MMSYEVYIDPDEGLAYEALAYQLAMVVTALYLCWTLVTTPLKETSNEWVDRG